MKKIRITSRTRVPARDADRQPARSSRAEKQIPKTNVDASATPMNLQRIQVMAGNRAVQRLVQRQEPGDETLFNIPDVKLPAPGGGKALPDDVRTKMESAFSQDFSAVRVHEDSSSADVGAYAYTRGHDIHFAQGQYNPTSSSGQSLLGHELTHVVQQRAGKVASPSQSGGVPVNADPRLEAEADKIGANAANHQPKIASAAVQQSTERVTTAAQLDGLEEDLMQGSWAVQRQGPEEEELLQGSWTVQRQGLEEEELQM